MYKIGIVGYGNLGRSAEKVIAKTSDMKVEAIFSRRAVKSGLGNRVESYAEMQKYVEKIDVMLLCSGSATDVPKQGREIIRLFNTADSFDTHAKIPKYYRDMDELGRQTGHLATIAIGWDPGLFSSMRFLFDSILPTGETYTFWGEGVSQGHSEAIRKLTGVKYGIQYTVPKAAALDAVRSGSCPSLTTRDKHERVCYVVAEEGADEAEITKQIVTMPNYFSDYDTTVNFISEEEFKLKHRGIPHGGFVIRSGESNGTKHRAEFSIKLQSNPDFTASILVAYARATARMAERGEVGARTVYEIPQILISTKSIDEVIKTML